MIYQKTRKKMCHRVRLLQREVGGYTSRQINVAAFVAGEDERKEALITISQFRCSNRFYNQSEGRNQSKVLSRVRLTTSTTCLCTMPESGQRLNQIDRQARSLSAESIAGLTATFPVDLRTLNSNLTEKAKKQETFIHVLQDQLLSDRRIVLPPKLIFCFGGSHLTNRNTINLNVPGP